MSKCCNEGCINYPPTGCLECIFCRERRQKTLNTPVDPDPPPMPKRPAQNLTEVIYELRVENAKLKKELGI